MLVALYNVQMETIAFGFQLNLLNCAASSPLNVFSSLKHS